MLRVQGLDKIEDLSNVKGYTFSRWAAQLHKGKIRCRRQT